MLTILKYSIRGPLLALLIGALFNPAAYEPKRPGEKPERPAIERECERPVIADSWMRPRA